MFKTLYAKLALVLILLLTVVGVEFSWFTLHSSKMYLQELNQRFNRDLARQLLVQKNMVKGEELSEKEIKELFSHYMHINPAIEIYLLDTQGKILAFEAPQMVIKRHKVDLEPIQHFLQNNAGYPILGDDPRHDSRQKVFSAAAYPFDGPPMQYLYVILGSEDYHNLNALVQDSYFLQQTLLYAVLTLILGVITGLFLFRYLTRRLQRLTLSLSRFRDSGFHEHQPYAQQPDLPQRDEIDTLGMAYDAMARRIIEQMQDLEQKDSLRRNLVANVSHDLRTPLASMQGYIETLQLKHRELSAEEREHYLNITYQQGERLAWLVSELFELAKLDAQETKPELEPLAMGELVQDVAQKYQLLAGGQDKEIQFLTPGELPLVLGDLPMLNRVMENLVINAIEHTPAGGRIVIHLNKQEQGVAISVCNSGTAIAEEDKAHLFERFYQSPERRGRKGAGLGLAIVRRILELHETAVKVESAEGMNHFTFELRAYQA